MFDNVWGTQDEIVLDHALEITYPVCLQDVSASLISVYASRLLCLLSALQLLVSGSHGRVVIPFP
jgi:hypothetical protein